MPLLLLTLFACYPIGSWDDELSVVPGDTGERVVVSPSILDFGVVDVQDDGSATASFMVFNLSEEEQILSGHDEPLDQGDGSAANFDVDAFPILTLPPGGSMEVPVTFRPDTDGAFAASLDIRPGETILLQGTGTAPVLSVGALACETAVVGCTQEASFPIYNQGSVKLDVYGVVVENDGSDESSDEFSVLSWPTSIEPGETGSVRVAFAPNEGGERTANLYLSTSDPLNPTRGVFISAMGAEGDYVEESFRYSPTNPTDILFLVKTGGGMQAQVRKAEMVIASYIETIRSTNTDYHITAMAGSSVCPTTSPTYATRYDTSSVAENLLESAFYGAAGTYDNNLLALGLAALQESDQGGCLEGFRRDTANLHVIVVSDIPSAADVNGQLSDLTDDVVAPAVLKISALVPLSDGICGIRADNYIDAANATGGMMAELCADDWTAAFTTLAEDLDAGAPVWFGLSQTPVSSTIEVLVEGNTLTGWTYDGATNTLSFPTDEVPTLGAEVTVRYVPASACE